MLGSQPLDRLQVLLALICMAGVERFAHPFEHLVVELQLAQELRELRF